VFVVTDLIGRRKMQTFDRLYLLLTKALDRPGGIDWLCDMAGPHAIPVPARMKLTQLGGDPVQTTHLLLKELPHDALDVVVEALESRFPLQAGCLDSHRALDWDMLEEMWAAGITIGSHTRTHPLLTLEDPARVRDEVEASRRILRQRLGREINHFAYPDGRYNRQVVAAVKKAGYRYGYGVCKHRDASDPLLTIPRRTFWENSCLDARGKFSSSVMSCSANGIFDLFTRCTRDHQAAGATRRTALTGKSGAQDMPGTIEIAGRSQQRETN
jgi:hypothetical protein